MLTDFLKAESALGQLAAAVRQDQARAYAPSYLQGFLLAALREAAWPAERLIVVAPDAATAARLTADLKAYAGAAPVCQLPARGVAWGSRLTPAQQVVGQRHAAIASLRRPGPCLVVAEALALQERQLSLQQWPEPLLVSKHGGLTYDPLLKGLVALGYERVEQVEDRGQFAVRGGIVDIFSSCAAAPSRLEFWGDELESIRSFSLFTQRSLLEEPELVVYAAEEPEGQGQRGLGLLAGLDTSAHLCHIDLVLAREAAVSFWEDSVETAALETSEQFYLNPDQLAEQLAGAALALESLPGDQPHFFSATGVNFGSRRLDEALRHLDRLVAEQFRVFTFFSSEGAARRLEHNLGPRARLLRSDEAAPRDPGVYLLVGPAPQGFVHKDLKLAVLAERVLLRPSRSARSQQLTLGGKAIMSFRDLTPGDYVVHQDHGIGVFEAIQTKTVAGITRDYLELRFKGEDRLFVPQEQIAKVSRYVGAGAGAPPLNKLGGRAWELARAKAKTAAREMAGELLRLYAARQSLPGFAFTADNEWQLQMESAFPYSETPDQAAAIEDVKDDMESPRPMDRLICGDVGYGKTEVALRAAFKAAIQGKQVLLLVPTTILALQHFKTLSKRFSSYPVNLEMISRFRSAAEGRRIARAFREGQVDILIGTHRLLSADIVPKDLGLVLVDEEQRFGVAQKETLRQLKLKVDVLSLSATPIPRTLQMSLSGIRDISVMETPPPGRNPIRTYVGEYDDELISQAVAREVKRGGQVFFLHNRVETIEQKAEELRSLLPQIRFIVAHGQMAERELEAVMLAFLEREADVLICTSIIESGLDIPTANTLIVDRADLLGLSQLYQIRGRIGRSDVTAHAYLFYPPAATLTKEAMARLSTLSDYTELGSGFKIAMRDLEIRGAGNLLGDEQSGHVAAVGFDMYCDLLRQAVADLKDKPVQELKVSRLEVDVDAYIPADYIPFEAARIDVHHRIAAAQSEHDLAELSGELSDRFGEVPQVVVNLLDMQEIRLRGGVLGAASITFRRQRLELADIQLAAEQKTALEEAGTKFAYYPLKRSLVVWTEAAAGPDLPVVKSVLDVIIGSLLLPVAKL